MNLFDTNTCTSVYTMAGGGQNRLMFVLQTCFVLLAAQNINHLSHWEITEDFDISDLIQFIQLEGVDFYKLCSGVGSLLLVDPTPLSSL